jgi:predicted RNA binding protein YcfA (HicA-like mRNA interferase family)
MAPTLPVLSGADVVRTFTKLGWNVARQRGSHVIMIKDGERATLSIPDHRTIAKGTLRSLIRAANMTVDDFVAASK